jgi:hypothetical protein
MKNKLRSNKMKVAMVKQALDLHGPLQSFKWNNDAEGLFPIWTPFKVTYWELTCVLKADWYIIPQKIETEYIRRTRVWFPNVTEVLMKYTKGVTPPEDIPWEKYDVIITFDPIIDEKLDPVLAYYTEEHTHSLYRESLIRPLNNYDLFLAHILDASDSLTAIPQSISFPLTMWFSNMRKIFNKEKEDSLWIDNNMMNIANMPPWKLRHKNVVRDAYNRLQMRRFLKKLSRYDIVMHTKKPAGLDATKMNDGKIYLDSLSRCKYYLGFERGRNKCGQSLVDASSMGSICFGEKGVAYHNLICHPFCLLESQESFFDKFNIVRASTKLQEEIKKWQDNALHEFFLQRPLDMLEKACKLKDNFQSTNK